MKFFCKLQQLKWGIILITVGAGVILALVLPTEIVVVMLAILLIVVGFCILKDDKKRF